jgi:hypothetical protein
MSITIQVSQAGEWQKLTYIGTINEDSEVHLPPVLSSLGKNVIVNFRQVDNVNSCGVRAWITFMRDLEKGRNVVFEECTPEIVSQINMIPNFKGSAQVHSLYGGYTCPSCGHHQFHLFVKGKNLPEASSDGAGEVKCEKCNGVSELDELEEEFFAWVDAG